MAASQGGSKVWTLLLGAIIFGVAAAILSVVYLKAKKEAIRKRLEGEKQQMVEVVVANDNLRKGTQVGQGAFAVRPVPAEFVHQDAILPAYFEQNAHRFLVHDVAIGRPLLESFLEDEFPIDFSDSIKPGRRAITIAVDDINSNAAMLRPGNHIDIYVAIPTRESGLMPTPPNPEDPSALVNPPEWSKIKTPVLQVPPGDIIMPVVQNVVVVATGPDAYEENLDKLNLPQTRSDRRYTNLTVEVTPQQAALIRTAEDKGEFVAMLRNREDQSMATFMGVTPQDLFIAAAAMVQEALLREAAAKAGATIDANGNWVTADGKVIEKDDLVVSADGTVTTRDGKLLAKEGVTIDANGKYVDENGTVVDAKNVVVQTADGRFVDANGNEIPPEDLVVLADGTVKTKAQMLAEAGLTVNENGDYVDADGNIIPKDDVIVLANGTVMTKDGRVLAGPPVTVNEQGFIVAADGTVMTPDGKVISGLRVNEKGEVVGPDGKKYNAKDLVVAADGSVRTRDGKVLAGVSAMTTGAVVTATQGGDTEGIGIDLILGGDAKDGVAKVAKLPVMN